MRSLVIGEIADKKIISDSISFNVNMGYFLLNDYIAKFLKKAGLMPMMYGFF
jgi:hypothetical protein